MSEQNILNPAGSDLNPDFPLPLPGLNPPLSVFQPRRGSPVKRIQSESGRIIPLTWTKRARSTADSLRQWEAQYRTGFFSFYHSELARYFTGCFADNLQIVQVGFEQWNISGTFVELPGNAMYVYPTNWARDAIFIEESDDSGNLIVRKVGAGWDAVPLSIAAAHGGTFISTHILDEYAEWLYFGYGFRWWGWKDNNLGIAEISLDGAVLGNVDLYNAARQNSAALLTQANTALGMHRVKVRCTHTKNAASSDYYILADAIEVMQ